MEAKSENFKIASSVCKNMGDTTYGVAAFVAGHRATLDYLARFGTPLEKAKANILFKIAEGVVL